MNGRYGDIIYTNLLKKYLNDNAVYFIDFRRNEKIIIFAFVISTVFLPLPKISTGTRQKNTPKNQQVLHPGYEYIPKDRQYVTWVFTSEKATGTIEKNESG